jgi:hypothetical protein
LISALQNPDFDTAIYFIDNYSKIINYQSIGNNKNLETILKLFEHFGDRISGKDYNKIICESAISNKGFITVKIMEYVLNKKYRIDYGTLKIVIGNTRNMELVSEMIKSRNVSTSLEKSGYSSIFNLVRHGAITL